MVTSSVLISFGCYIKYMLYQVCIDLEVEIAEIYCPVVLEARDPRSRCHQGHALSESSRGGIFLDSLLSGDCQLSLVLLGL